VAAGYNTDITVSIAKSTDGMTWTAMNSPLAIAYGIAWNGSYWVAVGQNNSTGVSIAKSTDGISWTPSTNNPFAGGQGYGIAWNGSYWVAVGVNTDGTVTIAKSTDGMMWAASDNPFPAGLSSYGIAWNGSYWVAVGDSPVCITTSTNGVSWTNVTNPFIGGTAYVSGIAWNGTHWVAVGFNEDNTVCIARSTDGNTWTTSTNNPFSGGRALGIAYGFLPTTATTNLSGPVAPVGPLNIGYTTFTPSVQGAMRGYIYELVVYNSALSTASRNAMEGYLAWKWGLVASLPASHPYKNYPPPPQ
jgi:hypothetical protein